MKINPTESIGFGKYNPQYSGNSEQNPNNSQNFKDSNKKQDFLDIIHETLNEKEQNNDNTNTISANSATTPILTPTNPYGRTDGGNYRFNVATQKQSTNGSENGRSNTATYNGGVNRIFYEKSRRSGSENESNQGLGEGSENITRLGNAEAYTTAEERIRLDRLEKERKAFDTQQAILAYKKVLEPNKQHTKDSIKPKQSKQNSNDFGRGL